MQKSGRTPDLVHKPGGLAQAICAKAYGGCSLNRKLYISIVNTHHIHTAWAGCDNAPTTKADQRPLCLQLGWTGVYVWATSLLMKFCNHAKFLFRHTLAHSALSVRSPCCIRLISIHVLRWVSFSSSLPMLRIVPIGKNQFPLKGYASRGEEILLIKLIM